MQELLTMASCKKRLEEDLCCIVLFFFFLFCNSAVTALIKSIQEDGCDKGAHQSYLGTGRNTLSIQTGFNLVNAAVVCAILESISDLELSSVITEPRYLKLVTVSSFYPFIFISVLLPLVLFVISLVFPALISMP